MQTQELPTPVSKSTIRLLDIMQPSQIPFETNTINLQRELKSDDSPEKNTQFSIKSKENFSSHFQTHDHKSHDHHDHDHGHGHGQDHGHHHHNNANLDTIQDKNESIFSASDCCEHDGFAKLQKLNE